VGLVGRASLARLAWRHSLLGLVVPEHHSAREPALFSDDLGAQRSADDDAALACVRERHMREVGAQHGVDRARVAVSTSQGTM
jgi:hypothetical protein